ncbi:hypothetical protein H6P81_002290 [Aristolochia fimbriata]|uniref:Uncharacterized protein n=1 Tax=Aristolochia fimbriata TaxID=158543 RepID=A0AAV7FCK8_ARIFI|nr:hypothetical protein H6P81_002290 [Aristolochia fimbriata]
MCRSLARVRLHGSSPSLRFSEAKDVVADKQRDDAPCGRSTPFSGADDNYKEELRRRPQQGSTKSQQKAKSEKKKTKKSVAKAKSKLERMKPKIRIFRSTYCTRLQVGINIRPPTSVESNGYVYVACPSSVYYEFIPIKRSYLTETKAEEGLYEESDPVRLTEVKVGEIYEVVITNYRYILGDIVKVTGFYNSSPELQFLHRKNVLLNICIDKTTERDLQLVMERASKRFSAEEKALKLFLAEEKVEIVDYTSYADSSTEPGHYVIFWELSHLPSKEILQKCCSYLDQTLPDAGYITARKSRGLGALELQIVAKGTFGKVVEHYRNLGSTIVQFKTPRCIAGSNTRVLQILDDNVCARFFSTAYA